VSEQTRHSPILSLTSLTDVQLLIDSLYRMLKFLYLRWLSELSGYRDYCQHRALRQMEQEEGDLTSAGVCVCHVVSLTHGLLLQSQENRA
jgi:hypothetical protein